MKQEFEDFEGQNATFNGRAALRYSQELDLFKTETKIESWNYVRAFSQNGLSLFSKG